MTKEYRELDLTEMFFNNKLGRIVINSDLEDEFTIKIGNEFRSFKRIK